MPTDEIFGVLNFLFHSHLFIFSLSIYCALFVVIVIHVNCRHCEWAKRAYALKTEQPIVHAPEKAYLVLFLFYFLFSKLRYSSV